MNVPDERFDWLCKLYKPKSEVCFFSSTVDQVFPCFHLFETEIFLCRSRGNAKDPNIGKKPPSGFYKPNEQPKPPVSPELFDLLSLEEVRFCV